MASGRRWNCRFRARRDIEIASASWHCLGSSSRAVETRPNREVERHESRIFVGIPSYFSRASIVRILYGSFVTAAPALGPGGPKLRGSIRGSVTDPSGGLVVGAKVVANNDATGLLPGRPPRPTAPTFWPNCLPVNTINRHARMGFAHMVAPKSWSMLASIPRPTSPWPMLAAALDSLTSPQKPRWSTSTRDVLGEVVDQQLVTELPLNGRDFGKLVALVPGATVEPSGVAAIQSGFGQFNINGNRDRSNNYTVDGTDNNDPFFNNSALTRPASAVRPASLLPDRRHSGIQPGIAVSPRNMDATADRWSTS